MNPEDVKVQLIEVLQEIQSDSGYEGCLIAGTTCPVTDLEGFDSPLWLDAIGMLATKLGVNIPDGSNIFLSEDGTKQLTVDECAVVVCEIVQRGKT